MQFSIDLHHHSAVHFACDLCRPESPAVEKPSGGFTVSFLLPPQAKCVSVVRSAALYGEVQQFRNTDSLDGGSGLRICVHSDGEARSFQVHN